MGHQRLVLGAVVIGLGLVLVPLQYAGQAGLPSPYPFGTEQPAGCSTYGLSNVENVSYWFCDIGINSTFWSGLLGGNLAELANLTFAEVAFNVEGWLGIGCPGLTVTGLETNGAVHTFEVGTYNGISGPCLYPTPLRLASDLSFGAIWASPGSVELLVRAGPS